MNKNGQIIGMVYVPLHKEEDDNIIKKLINDDLMNCIYGNESFDEYSSYVYLIENESKILQILEQNGLKGSLESIPKTMSEILDCQEMNIRNIFGDNLGIEFSDIYGLIEDELEEYISKEKQLEIYNSIVPAEKLIEVANQVGRGLLEIKLNGLLLEVKHAEFK